MTASGSHAKAFTLIELAATVAIIAVLAALFLRTLATTHSKDTRISCVNNLKQIGVAYRIWSDDHGDKFPAKVSQIYGGWSNLLSSTNGGAYAWTNYYVMENEFGLIPKILVCPVDERKPAGTFSTLSNINISYFVGPDASDDFPQALLGGDRNLGPGDIPRDDYGFSSVDGKGIDVTIKGPVCWSLKMHSKGNTSGAGNILLGDGSVQQFTSGNLNLNWLKPAMEAYANSTNGPVSSNGIRLIFP